MIAGAWLRLPVAQPGCPQVHRLAQHLAVEQCAALGVVVALQAYAFTYYPDGCLGACDSAELARAALYRGDATRFLQQLVSAGVVDQDGRLFDWLDLQGPVLQKRERDRERMRTLRRESCDRRATRRATSQGTDVRTYGRKDDSSEPRPAAAEPVSPALLVFPTVGKVTSWSFTQKIHNEYGALYPTLDIDASARRALHWLTTVKPTGKKTAAGMHRFLSSWFDRAVGKGEDLLRGGNGKPQAGGPPVSSDDLAALRRAREETGAQPGGAP